MFRWGVGGRGADSRGCRRWRVARGLADTWRRRRWPVYGAEARQKLRDEFDHVRSTSKRSREQVAAWALTAIETVISSAMVVLMAEPATSVPPSAKPVLAG